MPQPSDSPLLQIEDLTKVFHTRQGFSSKQFHAVDGATLSLQADKPEIFTVAGESGSGKTTLARLILGLEQASTGTLSYKGRSIGALSSREKRAWYYKEVQPVFQDPFATFSPLKRIDHYLYETVYNYKITDRAGANAYIDGILNEVGLSLAEIKGRYPGELSGGQAQRVSIARALITHPSLIVADEPVSMLDASLRMSIVNMFRKLKENQHVSVLYITHDLATAYYAADRIAVMLRGWIVEMGPVEQVLGDPKHPYTQNLKQSIPPINPDAVWNEKMDLAQLDSDAFAHVGCKYANRCPHVMEKCRTHEPPNILHEGRTVKCFLYE
ncbi:MAG: ABC transporter ATP-binding protein [Chloroflexota bacterium]|nr:ABC transporter ATP-binding protein [Chloroflexota bacterium]